MNEWFVNHPWIAFILIYIFLAYVYNKVFRVRKLPILKELIIYLMFGLGAGMLLLFQLDAGLPIIPCLSIAVALMFMVRIRYFVEKRQNKKS